MLAVIVSIAIYDDRVEIENLGTLPVDSPYVRVDVCMPYSLSLMFPVANIATRTAKPRQFDDVNCHPKLNRDNIHPPYIFISFAVQSTSGIGIFRTTPSRFRLFIENLNAVVTPKRLM